MHSRKILELFQRKSENSKLSFILWSLKWILLQGQVGQEQHNSAHMMPPVQILPIVFHWVLNWQQTTLLQGGKTKLA